MIPMGWIDRRLRIDLPPRQSAFLWGPRKTGKSAFLERTFPGSIRFDLLRTDLRLDLLRRPALLRERLLAMEHDRLEHPVIIDEPEPRRQEGIDVLPWREFLRRLWGGGILR
jgi:hypothetical protein